MKFQPPGGELTFWSILWILFGFGAVYYAATKGDSFYYVIAACVGLPAIGMWFDLRLCGYVLAGVLALTIPLALVAMFTIDDTWSERMRRLLRIAAAGYFVYLSLRWAQDDE